MLSYVDLEQKKIDSYQTFLSELLLEELRYHCKGLETATEQFHALQQLEPTFEGDFKKVMQRHKFPQEEV